MDRLIEGILVFKKNNCVYFFDPQNFLIFSKKNLNISDEELINRYKKKIYADNKEKPVVFNPSKFSSVTIELHITNNCNLRCKYCFVDQKCFQEKHKQMSEETIEKAFKFALKAYPEANSFNICLFGGEPLLFVNKFKFIKDKAKEIFQEKKFRISLTTNGTIFNDDVVSIIKDNQISFLISWDGPKKEHDYLRHFPNEKGSFDIIEANINKYRHVLNFLSVRCTITPYNMKLLDLFIFFQKKGFKKIHFSLCSSSINNLIIKKEDLPKLFEECDKLIDYYLKHLIEAEEIIHVYPFIRYLRALHFGDKKYSFCATGKNLFVVSPDEKIYSCHRLIENEKFQIGDLQKGFDNGCKKRKELLEFNVDNEEKCKTCFAKYICGGGCEHEKYTSFSDIACQYTRHILGLCIWLYVELQSKHPEAYKKFIDSLENKNRLQMAPVASK